MDINDFNEIPPIRDLICEKLRKAIFEGEFQPGDRLVEKDLADSMKVSRTPVREALRKLESEGLVVHIPRKGVVVKGFTPKDVIEIYSIRKALESLCVTYTIDNADEEIIKQLEFHLQKMNEYIEKGDDKKLFYHSEEYNRVLREASKMQRLINMINTMREYLARFREVSMTGKARKLNALKEHTEILKAIKNKDKEKAMQLIHKHIDSAMRAYMKTYNIKQ